MPLYFGIAEADITPPPGVWMCGYAFRPTGCTGIRDPLSARALVLQDGHSTVAVVAMDLLGLDFDMVEEVRRGVAERTGIPGHALLLNATHTHGGPNVRTFNTMGERDPAYIDELVRKLIEIVVLAADNLDPASFAFGQAPVQIGVNRRQYTSPEGGGTKIGRNLAGPVDERVQSIVVRNSRHEPRAILFSHACHPTTVGGDNLEITADFPGVACGVIRRTIPSVVPFFLQACCGNINPEPRGTFDDLDRHGTALGAAALKSYENAMPLTGNALAAEERAITLPLIAPPTHDVIQKNLDHWEEQIRALRHADRPGLLMHAEGLRDYFRMEMEIARRGLAPLTKRFVIQRLGIGELQVLGLPAEMFVQYQLDFERQTASPLLTLAYTNGVHGYVPIAADYPFGGYEVDGAHRYYGTLMFKPECETLIRDEVYSMLRLNQPDRTPYTITAT